MDDAREVSTAHATAAKKILFPRTACKKGISAPTAPSPARKTELRIQTALRKIRNTAIPEASAGRRTDFPISQKTGTANATFIPAYKRALSAPPPESGCENANAPRP